MARYARATLVVVAMLFTVTASAGPFLKATQAYAFREPETRRAEFDADALRKGASELEIDGKSYTVDPATLTTEVGDDEFTSFRLRGAEATSHITIYKGFSVGDVWTPEGQHYHLVAPIFEAAKLVKVIPKAMDCGVVEGAKATSSYSAAIAASATLSSRRRTVDPYGLPQYIRVMVLYTSAAAMDTVWGGTGSIAGHEAWIRSEMANINLFAADSGAPNVHFVLSYEGLTPLQETDSRNQNLALIEQDANAKVLRKQYEADVVVYWTFSGGNRATAPQMIAQFGPSAGFAVVDNQGVSTIFGFQHEIGHILGLQHNVEDTTTVYASNALQWNRGYWNRQGKLQDIMGVARSEDGSTGDGLSGFQVPNIPRYSSPVIQWNGLATGTDMADNARMLRLGAIYVSQYHKQL